MKHTQVILLHCQIYALSDIRVAFDEFVDYLWAVPCLFAVSFVVLVHCPQELTLFLSYQVFQHTELFPHLVLVSFVALCKEPNMLSTLVFLVVQVPNLYSQFLVGLVESAFYSGNCTTTSLHFVLSVRAVNSTLGTDRFVAAKTKIGKLILRMLATHQDSPSPCFISAWIVSWLHDWPIIWSRRCKVLITDLLFLSFWYLSWLSCLSCLSCLSWLPNLSKLPWLSSLSAYTGYCSVVLVLFRLLLYVYINLLHGFECSIYFLKLVNAGLIQLCVLWTFGTAIVLSLYHFYLWVFGRVMDVMNCCTINTGIVKTWEH